MAYLLLEGYKSRGGQVLLDVVRQGIQPVLLHKIKECTWDPSLKAVILPRAQTKMAAIADFEQQDWVKQLMQEENPRQSTKTHVDSDVAFPFQDGFSIRTIHGATAKATTPS
jgi:hypothetical protein